MVLYANQGASQFDPAKPNQGIGRILNPASGYVGGSIGDYSNPGHVQRQFVVNGEVLARYGDAPDPASASSSPGYISTAEFSLASSPRQLRGANANPVQYTVVEGESLKSIARAVLGDANLWYTIAQANGLSGSETLSAGQVLTVPKTLVSANNSSIFKPYDPTQVRGDTSPVQPDLVMPSGGGGGGCGGLGQIIMLVVAVAVAYYTGGAAAEYMAFSMEAGSTATAIGSVVVGAAAGSVASQVVGNAIGAQQGFSWNAVAMAALSAGVTHGLGSGDLLGATADSWLNSAVQTAVGNALTQGIAVATGLQQSFSWSGVAASAVGAGVGYGVGSALDGANLNPYVKAGISSFAAGTAAAVARGGRVSVQQVATDAFGQSLASAFVNNMGRPGAQEDRLVQSSQESFGGGEVNAQNSSEVAYTGGEAWATDVAMRRQASDPMGLMAMADDSVSVKQRAQALWGPMPTQADDGTLSSSATDAERLAQKMQQAGYDGELVPMAGGSVRVTPSMGLRPAMVNGVSVNQRADAAFQGAGDLLGMGDMYRDYKLLGGLMSEGVQNATLDKLKGALQDKLGMMRVLPTPEALGATPSIGSDGSIRYNNADLIDRYGDALRKTEMWKKGIIELDTRSMLITSIGNQRMSPTQWTEENIQRYQRALTVGIEGGQQRYANGTLPFPVEMPEQLQVGIYGHQQAERAVVRYNQSLGVPEGPGQLLVMNRWAYDPSGSGMTMRPDMFLDLGPNRGDLVLRHVVDGKSSMTEAMASGGQLNRYRNYLATPAVTAVTPQGIWSGIPRGKGR